MLKKISIRKLLISISALCVLFLIYFLPSKNVSNLEEFKQELIYVDSEVETSPIFLMDVYNYLGRSEVAVVSESKNIESRCTELINILIKGGIGEDKIPNGFKSILPEDTKILSLKYENNLVKINFSAELLEIDEEIEEKMIEAIVYTLTSVDEVENIIIYVDGNILTKLPKTKINLPSTLDRSFGINKEYDITSSKNINSVTVYYINKNNQGYYYVPVTKYLNDDRDKIKIVIEELNSSSIYNTNLMSFLNSNAKLLTVEQIEDTLQLEFNSNIFNDLDSRSILEEVIYTIALSVGDNYDVKNVSFVVNEQEIYKTVIKTIE